MPRTLKASPAPPSWAALAGAAALAVVLLGLGLGWAGSGFWLKLAAAYVVLAALSLLLRPPSWGEFRPRPSDLAWGLGSALALWLLFWLGNLVAAAIFPFAAQQVAGIYGQGGGAPPGLAGLALLFFTGPCEELFWRRYLQDGFMRRLGPGLGWAAAWALYAGAHLASGNFMFVGAAAVAGAFWGLLYWKLGRVWPLLISHAVWAPLIFVILPIP
ncbi:MAG: CPBP family intramembrane metalloprotease [Desulfarculaceae bacterium]|nr:CPBP family intramembrane metalloprotease [Desulfarculaceae bacterium]